MNDHKNLVKKLVGEIENTRQFFVDSVNGQILSPNKSRQQSNISNGRLISMKTKDKIEEL